MKRSYVLALLACLALIFAAGCIPPQSPLYGFVYMDVNAFHAATPGVLGKKKGTAYCESFVGIIARGDCSIETAAREAHITRISHVDYHSESILGLYCKVTVEVYGD